MRRSFLARFHDAAARPGVPTGPESWPGRLTDTDSHRASMAWTHRDHAQEAFSRLGSAQHRLEIAGAIVYRAAMLQKFIFALAIGASCPGVAMAEPRSGIDISAIDSSVRPQDDF